MTHMQQHWWADQIGSFFRKGLMDQATVRDAIRLSQIAGPASSGWMAARPSASLGLSFDPATYRVRHLRIPLLPPSLEGSPCHLGCGSPVDSYGDHVVCCRKNKAWERHLGIQSYLSLCLQNAAIPHRREQSMAGDLKRDADILIPSWDAGTGLAIDVGICHPYPPGTDNTSATAAAKIMSDRCFRKESKYSERCQLAGCTFCPMVLST